MSFARVVNIRHADVRPHVLSCVLAALACGCARIPTVVVDVEDGAATSEDGDSVTLTISIAERPRTSIAVWATSSNDAEGQSSDVVRFDADDWQEAKYIQVTGVDDSRPDGDTAYTITVVADTPGRRPEIVAELQLVNRDNDRARFTGLGDLPGGDVASHATAASATGEVIVGWSRGPDGDEAVRWTAATGLQGLGGPGSQASGISQDGALVVGTVENSTYERGRAAGMWRADTPFEIFPPPLAGDGTPLFWMVEANAVQNDGHAFGACIQRGAYGLSLKCAFVPPDELSVDSGGRILAADEVGNIAGTNLPDPRAGVYGSEAFYDDARLGYPAGSICTIPHACQSEARAFSDGGGTVVGTSRVPSVGVESGSEVPLFDTAFIHTQADGMLRLPDLPGGGEASGAYAVDATGRIVGGFGTDAAGQRAAVWIDQSVHSLEDVLVGAGGELPEGYRLREIRAVSSDGRTFVGNAINAAGQPEAFQVVLPVRPESTSDRL